MSDDLKRPTPKLDELESGPWPSFVRELKRAAATNPMERMKRKSLYRISMTRDQDGPFCGAAELRTRLR
jgi:hypothetical protein